MARFTTGLSDFFSSLFGAARHSRGPVAAPGAIITRAWASIWRRPTTAPTRTLELRRPEVKPMARWSYGRTPCASPFRPAVTEGQLIRLAGQGEPPSGAGQAGDLYLEVHIQPHRLFQLEGRDVTLTFPVAPWKPRSGPRLRADTGRHGRDAHSRRRPSGQTLRLRGRGLPGQPAGDQYVQLKVVLPPANTPQAKALYEKCAASSISMRARTCRGDAWYG